MFHFVYFIEIHATFLPAACHSACNIKSSEVWLKIIFAVWICVDIHRQQAHHCTNVHNILSLNIEKGQVMFILFKFLKGKKRERNAITLYVEQILNS